jgi:hypothetical protein
VTANNSCPELSLKGKEEVDSQVAAPAEMSNTQLAPSENRSHQSADGRVATEAAWLKPKTKDSDRKTKKPT